MMGFTYEDRIIIRYIRQTLVYGAIKIVNDHPEFNWNVHGVKTLLIGEMNKLTKDQKYLFMQDGARAHTANFTFDKLNKHLKEGLARKELYT